MTRTTTPRRAAGRHSGVGRVLTLAGVVCLVLALGLLGWTAWDMVLRPPVDPAVASSEVAGLRAEWAASPVDASPAPVVGQSVALLRIPALGDDEWPVLLGTDDATLRRGLGLYEGTAEPGEVGNVAIAGHGGLNGPFHRLTDLAAGDDVLVETREAVHTYRVTSAPAETVVSHTDTWVLQPVPGRPEIRPTEALITLTTSPGILTSDERVVAFGTLVESRAKG